MSDPEYAEAARQARLRGRGLRAQLHAHAASAAAARLAVEEMLAQLRALQDAVVAGRALRDSNAERARALRAARARLAERRARGLALRRELARRAAARAEPQAAGAAEAGPEGLALLRARLARQKERVLLVTQEIEAVRREHRGRADDLAAAAVDAARRARRADALARVFLPPEEVSKLGGWETPKVAGRADAKRLLAAARGAAAALPRGNAVPRAREAVDAVRVGGARGMQMEMPEPQTEPGPWGVAGSGPGSWPGNGLAGGWGAENVVGARGQAEAGLWTGL